MQKPLDKLDKHGEAVIKRGGRRHEEHDPGGAWKVAFADFCLALMALFLVLWLMASREQQAMRDIVQQANGSYSDGQGSKPEVDGGPRGSLLERFALPHHGSTVAKEDGAARAAPRLSYESPEELAALSRLLMALSADAGLASNLAAVVVPQGLRVTLHDTDRHGMFMRGSALPTGRFGALLRKMGPLFAQMENQMLIVGHTDSLAYAAGDGTLSNWSLSSNRAMSARAQLLAGGMRADSVLQVVGMADRAPLAPGNGLAAVNRRIEMLILTRRQADSVTAMFGVTGGAVALIDGADISLPAGAQP